ncbi:MAG: NAD-dependent epimerase/dehydratase family protein [Cyanobacteria bacterium P01_H01_bin.15]
MTGSTGLTGNLLLGHYAHTHPGAEVTCLLRETSDRTLLERLSLSLDYVTGDSASTESWRQVLATRKPETIIHVAQLRQVPALLAGLKAHAQTPRLIIIGTTGIYSKFNEYAQEYIMAEAALQQYTGAVCLLRPTMIYGSPRDKNIHRLIRFCDRNGFFFVFGPGNNLLQPIHADDVAQALLAVWQNPQLSGGYEISGADVIAYRELIELVGKLLGKPIRQLSFPLGLGINLATMAEKILGARSPVKREQILRLQEDKAYAHQAAHDAFGFSPRTLEAGLRQEIELMRSAGMIS